MTGIALVGGILLPESIMRSHWFAALSMFVAVNTVLYLTLAVITVAAPEALSQRLCGPTHSRRAESRRRSTAAGLRNKVRGRATRATGAVHGHRCTRPQLWVRVRHHPGWLDGREARPHPRGRSRDKAFCGETGRKVNNYGRGVSGPGLLAFTGPLGKEHTCQRCERKSRKPEELKPAKYVAARVFRGRNIHAFILGNQTMICGADGSPMLTPKAAITCKKCKTIIFGDTDGYIRGPHG